MIEGVVVLAREPVVQVTLLCPDGSPAEIDAVVDTGCTAELVLPADAVAELGLPFEKTDRAIIADGSEIECPIHQARVLWDGVWRDVSVTVSETDPLVGMALMEGYRLSIDVIDHGRVALERLSPPGT